MSAENWVLPEEVVEATQGRVNWSIELPEYVGGLIVNHARLNLMRRLSGASTLDIVHAQAAQNSYEVDLDQVNSDGSVTNVFGVRQKDTPSGSVEYGPIQMRWGVYLNGSPASIHIDMSVLHDKAVRSTEGVRSPKVWSKITNQEIKDKIIKLSDMAHVTAEFKNRILGTVASLGLLGSIATGSILENPALGLVAGSYYSFEYLCSFLNAHTHEDVNVQPSLITGARLDRALLSRLITPGINTVKPKP